MKTFAIFFFFSNSVDACPKSHHEGHRPRCLPNFVPHEPAPLLNDTTILSVVSQNATDSSGSSSVNQESILISNEVAKEEQVEGTVGEADIQADVEGNGHHKK